MKILNGIVCYNDHDVVNILIKKLRAEKWGDILVVDNSVDNLAPLDAATIVSDKNNGSAGGFKRLMEEARNSSYDFIVLHDSDGYPLMKPEFSSLQKDRVYNAFLTSDRNMPNKVSNRSFVFGPFMAYDPQGIFKVVGPSSGKIIPIDIIEAIGVYDDENYFVNLEDYEYDLRCHQSGIKVSRMHNYVYIHPNHTDHRGFTERFGLSIFNIKLPNTGSKEREKRMLDSSLHLCRTHFSYASRYLIFIVSVMRTILKGQFGLFCAHSVVLRRLIR